MSALDDLARQARGLSALAVYEKPLALDEFPDAVRSLVGPGDLGGDERQEAILIAGLALPGLTRGRQPQVAGEPTSPAISHASSASQGGGRGAPESA